MPPKDHTELGPGAVYIAREGEAPIPLDGIQEAKEATFEPAEGGVVDPAIVIGGNIAGEATLTVDIDAQYDAWMELYVQPMGRALYEMRRTRPKKYLRCVCAMLGLAQPKDRVLHLALRAKKKKDRIKNMRRLLRGD